MAVENVLLWADGQSVAELYEPVMSLVLHGLDPGTRISGHDERLLPPRSPRKTPRAVRD
jgi:hypothetical protein